MPDALGHLYAITDEERAVFGPFWTGPDAFEHGVDVVLATYPNGSGGHDVVVTCSALPSRFYAVVAKPYVDYEGKTMPGFMITTGSGDVRTEPGKYTPSGRLDMAEVAHIVALTTAQSMLSASPGI